MTLKNYMNMIYKNCELKNYVYRWSRSSSDLYPSLAIAWFSREYKGEETSLEKRKGETAKGDPFYLLAVPLPPPPPSPSPSLLCQVRAKVYVCLLFVYKGLHSLYPAAQPFSEKKRFTCMGAGTFKHTRAPETVYLKAPGMCCPKG